MRLLVRADIIAALQNPGTTALAYNLDDSDPPQRVQVGAEVEPASLDLTIGEIFIPDTQTTDWGGSGNGKHEHDLAQGHTAVIRTRERLRMRRDLAAIAFPPARASLRGLLMTNPGHIDPGYDGPLHCTVINMGHAIYPLRRGDKIMRVLFFELSQAAQTTPAAGIGALGNMITTELLSRLSVDFVDVDKRSKTIANDAVSRATIRATVISALIPIGLALITFIATAYFGPLQGIKDDISKVQQNFSTTATKLDEQKDVYVLTTELATLKIQLEKEGKFDERLKALEDKLKTFPVSSQQSPGHQ